MIQKLIDAYELEREMYRKCIDTDEEIEKGRAKWDSGLWIRYKVFEDTIILAPRVDTVKHGHWTIEDIITYERSYGGTLYEPVYKCSCCGRVTESYVRGDEPIMPEDADFPEFCGNCGAKMDEMKVNNSKGIDLWMTKEDFNSLYEDDVEDGV